MTRSLAALILVVFAMSPLGAAQSLLVGAWPNPLATKGQTASTMTRASALQTSVGHLDLILNYLPWNTPFPTADITAETKSGSTPIVSLSCGDTDTHVAAGAQDALIKKLADEMRDYKNPIVLRLFWEMNNPTTENGRTSCVDASIDTGGYFEPAHYIAMWKHVHDVFVAEGATNVSWFFCSGGAGAVHPGSAYYPGDAYVDENGFDIYDRKGVGFAKTIAASYKDALAASSSKPIWVGETGAMANQATYLDASVVAKIRSEFPLLGAVIYFDAGGPHGDWSLTPAGTSAFSAFITAAHK